MVSETLALGLPLVGETGSPSGNAAPESSGAPVSSTPTLTGASSIGNMHPSLPNTQTATVACPAWSVTQKARGSDGYRTHAS